MTTPDPVTTALSALREMAVASDFVAFYTKVGQQTHSCSPALIAALCDGMLCVGSFRQSAVGTFEESAAQGKINSSYRRLAAVIKETGNG